MAWVTSSLELAPKRREPPKKARRRRRNKAEHSDSNAGFSPRSGNSRASELELKCEPQHAGIGDRRGLTADAPRQVGFDGCSQRLAFSQDCVRIDDIENLAFGRQGHLFAGMEDLPEANVELIQT